MERPINNRKFQEFMNRFVAETVSTKVRSLMWECWGAATDTKCQHRFFSSSEFGFVKCKYCGETYPIECAKDVGRNTPANKPSPTLPSFEDVWSAAQLWGSRVSKSLPTPKDMTRYIYDYICSHVEK